MTQKEIEALRVSFDGKDFALCKANKAGKLIPVRKITKAEIASMLSMMYAQFITQNEGEKIMMLPMDDKGNALAVTFAQPVNNNKD